MRLQNLIALICAFVLAACASAPTPKTDQPTPIDPDTAATIHMYRPDSGIVGAALDHYVYIDGFKVGRLNSTESVEVKIAPGEREIIVQPHFVGIPDGTQLKLLVTVALKQDVYVRYSTSVAGVYLVGNIANAQFKNRLQLVSRASWVARE